MAPAPSSIVPALTAAEAGVRSARSLAAAVRAIGIEMPEEFDISRVGLRRLDSAGARVRIIGIWSEGPTELTPGLWHPAAGEMYERTFGGLIESRSPRVIVLGDAEPAHLFENLLIEEGHASAMGVPLLGSGAPAVLALLSRRREAFDAVDLRAFEAFGAAISEPLLGLADIHETSRDRA